MAVSEEDDVGRSPKGDADTSASQHTKHQPLVPGTVLRSERPTKVKVEANVARDIVLFLLFVSFGLFFSYTALNDIGVVDEGTLKKRSLLKKVRAELQSLLPLLKKASELPEEKYRCSLYIATSSINGAGYGLFAGKDISQGQTAVIDTGVNLPISEDAAGVYSSMPQHGFIIKPHPTASNVELAEWKEEMPYYKAKRDIFAGEELFVNMPTGDIAEAYFALFERVPTADSYITADSILAKEMQDLTRRKVPARQKKGDPRRPAAKVARSRMIEKVDEKSLVVIKNIVSRYDARSALLLPLNSRQLALSMVHGVGVSALNNRTMGGIYELGHCFDGVELEKTSAEVQTNDSVAASGAGAEAEAKVTRNVSKGHVIMSAPVYAIGLDLTEEGDIPAVGAAESNCLRIRELLLCPLSSALVSIDHGNSNDEPTNAVYAWSKWNPSWKTINEMGLQQAAKRYPVDLSLDIVATRDLVRGEKIVIASSSIDGLAESSVAERQSTTLSNQAAKEEL